MHHAWLIIAHNEFGVLQKLVSMLDDGRSDFYVHIDRKVAALPELHVEKGRLTFLQKRPVRPLPHPLRDAPAAPARRRAAALL